MLFAMMPAGVNAAEEVASDSTDFVLVLDCSGSLMGNDRELALSACKMFVDLIPVENARVSVLIMGKPGSPDTVYSFSSDFMKQMDEYERNGTLRYRFASATRDNLNSLHTIVPLDGAKTLAVKQSYKDRIVEASKQIGQQTPITHALAAALDLLQHNGAEPGNACVILLTDGEMTSGEASESVALKKWVIENANDSEWPIYCIDTNFGRDIDDGLLNEISKGSGYANGKMKSESAVEICGHFLEIFNHFMENKNGTQEMVELKSGVAEHAFTVPMLSSETNIVVAASDPNRGLEIAKVELFAAGSNEPIITVTDKDVNKEIGNPVDVMATVDKGVYFCLKMITPSAGDYVLRAYGPNNSDASILIYDSSLQEMDLAMTTDPMAGASPVDVTRDQTISINAAFSYADYKVSSTDEIERGYYEKQNAVLYAYDAQDHVLFYDNMSIGDNGYHYDLKLNETTIPSDQNFRIAVKIEKNDMYRTGEKESNSAWFNAQNREPVATNTEPISLQGNVNMEMNTDILLGNLYTEADGDIMTYELTDFKQVLDNGPVSIQAFESGMRENTDAVWIRAGLKPGQYEATLILKESGSGATLKYTVKMDVQNNPINYIEMEPVEIWTNYFPLFQTDEYLEWETDLNAYFSDYERVAISYSVHETEETGLLAVTHTEGSSQLFLEPAGEETGKTSLTIVASQYAGDEMTDSLEVTVPIMIRDGRAEFWKENWIWFALAAALIALIVITIIFLSLSTRVKGTWKISYEENGSYTEAGTVRIGSALPCGRKKKFTLREMIEQVNHYADEQDRVIANVPNYFMDEEIRKIQLQGITFGSSGFVVANIPDNENKITVEYMGKYHKKKVKVSMGRIQFSIKTADGYGVPNVLTITMESAGR